MQVSLNETREDEEAENQKVDACEHFVNQGRLTSSQSQYACGKDGIWDIKNNQIYRYRMQTNGFQLLGSCWWGTDGQWLLSE